ncbi:MAG: hypothetical protein IJ751_08035 [Oscillospiraceae bacterium]|nr:hypothetical protein [Oscillospiraceae bacterium]
MNEDRYAQFRACLNDFCRRPELMVLRTNPQHRGNITYQHSRNVAIYAFYLAERWHWRVDIPSLVRGAMLHDFYLYDARAAGHGGLKHAMQHPRLALRQAQPHFVLNPVERNISLSH